MRKLQKKRNNIEVKYVRDKRSPTPKNENVSRVMSANKRAGTGPEVLLRKSLWANNLRGYRKNWDKAPGCPDIVFVKHKLAIFVHGCYWHRCPNCNYRLPKTNRDFWRQKFAKNKERDDRKVAELKTLAWNFLVVWECEVNKNISNVVKKIQKKLSQ